jgi:predicted kinase
LEEAGALFGKAIAYLEPAPPRLLALGGVSGTGKSTLARILAPMMGPPPGAVVIRSDVLRKQLMGVDETTRLPPAAYQPDINDKVYAMMTDLSARILSTGHAAIVDAVHGKPQERDRIEEVAARRGIRFDGLWLEAPPAVLEERIAARRGDASDATIDVLRRQLDFIQRPANWDSIDVSHFSAEIAKQLYRRLDLQNSGSTAS